MMRRFKPVPHTMLFVILAGCLAAYGQTPNCQVRNTNTAAAAITIPNLSGAYTSDASAIYYMEHTNSTLWWAGMSVDSALPLEQQWHRGLQYTNVFRGTVYCDGTILGQWVDVPRGVNLGSGTLTLTICTTCQPVQIKQVASTGGFGGNTWWFRGTIDDLVVDYPSKTTMDINSRFGQVYKDQAANNWTDTPQTLFDNLHPYRDQTVIYGWINTLAHTCGPQWVWMPGVGLMLGQFVLVQKPCYPEVGYTADWGNRDRDFKTFMRTGDGDGDLDFNLTIDTAMMERDFYATGWGNNDHHVIYRKLNEYPGEPSMHLESIMYGWQGSLASSPGLHLIPGWADTSSNSVLINGRPANGSVLSPSPTSSCKFIQPCPSPAGNKGLLFRDHKILGSLDGTSSGGLANQTYLRVSGTLVIDCGHGWGGCDNDAGAQDQEIHPVYSIDIIEHPFRPEDGALRARPNLTGTWGGVTDGSTYYLRHIGNKIWGLAQMRDRAPMQSGDKYPAIGCDPESLQCAPFAIVFEGDVTERPDGSATVTGAWGGVPQSTTAGSSGGTIAFSVTTNRKVIALTGLPAMFSERLVKLYEPEDTVPPQSKIATVDAPVAALSPAGPGRGGLGGVAHAKNVTISATDTGSGVQGIWYRHYTGPGQPPPFTFAAGPAVSFILSGTGGSYSVDYYATDNAGNDEAPKHAIVSFQVVLP